MSTRDWVDLGGDALNVLEGLANWVGAGDTLKRWLGKIREAATGVKQVSPIELSGIVTRIVKTAATKAGLDLSDLQNKLSQVMSALPLSQTQKEAIDRLTTRISSEYKQKKMQVAKGDTLAALAETKVGEAQAKHQSGQIATGDYQRAVDEAKDLAKQAADAYDLKSDIERIN